MPLDGKYAPGTSGRSRTQAERYEASQGREANMLSGKPIIVLTTVGSRSGTLRKTPLMRVEHDGRYAVVASAGGATTHPAWYRNLLADPRAELQDGATRMDVVARELAGDERTRWWARALECWPDYARYQAKTARLIPVMLLEPGAAAAP